MAEKTFSLKSSQNLKKRCSRLACVQMFYMISMTGISTKMAIDYLSKIKSDIELDINNDETQDTSNGDKNKHLLDLKKSDNDYLFFLLNINDIVIYDEMISSTLINDITDLNIITLSIIRSATNEMKIADINSIIVINEYIEIAKSFFGNSKQIGFINGVLNKIKNLMSNC